MGLTFNFYFTHGQGPESKVVNTFSEINPWVKL
jgi:hypothetical protein